MKETYERIVIGLVAENNSGKSTLAKELELMAGWKHYSVREYIAARYKRNTGKEISTERDAFTNFSQNQKNKYGVQTFALDPLKSFLDTSDQVCIIESFRSPEETEWLKKLSCYNEKRVKGMPIGITAPLKQRKEWFLRGRPDEVAKEISEAEFWRQETLVNSGTQPWEENVTEAMKFCVTTFANPEGKLKETASTIISFFNQFLIKPVTIA